jgi:integrase
LRLYKRKDVWYVDYTREGKRIRQRVGENRKLAEAVLSKIKVSKVENRFLDVHNNPDIDLNRLSNSYIKYARINKRTWMEDSRYVNNFLTYCKDNKIEKITTLTIEEYKEELYNKVRQSSINKALSVLRRMFNLGMLWGLCNYNPVKGIRFYNENRFRRTRYLTKEELSLFVGQLPKHIKPVFLLALNTGLRRGELLSLEWKDIDFHTQIITVKETKNDIQRFIPMNKEVVKILKALPKDKQKVVSVGKSAIRYNFNRLKKKLNIQDFHFHDLRHTFASYLVMNGVDLRTVQELLGHKSFAMTQRYSHLSQEHKKDAVNRLLHDTNLAQGVEKTGRDKFGFDSKSK